MSGILPIQDLIELHRSGAITSANPLGGKQIQPSSVDLRLGHTAYRVRASFLPGAGRTVEECLTDIEMHRFSIADGAVLEKDAVYIIPAQEALNLPSGMAGIANAKSSTGRLDVMTRLITNYGVEFDRIQHGYTGPLFLEIRPRSFSVVVAPDLCLLQVRFFEERNFITDGYLRSIHSASPIIEAGISINDGLRFSVDMIGINGIVGYKAKRHCGIVDLRKLAHYEISDFWDPVYAPKQKIVLDPGEFYILMSREAVIIPPSCAAEMAPYMAMVGEFRVH